MSKYDTSDLDAFLAEPDDKPAAPTAPKYDTADLDAFLADEAAPAVEPKEMKAGEVVDHSRPKTGAGSALLRGAAQGGWANLPDEATAMAGTLKDYLLAKAGERGDIAATDLPEVYRSWRKNIRGADAKAQQDRPGIYGTGEVLGGVVSAMAPTKALNASKGAKLAEVTGKSMLQGGLSGMGASEGESWAENLADASKGGAIGAAAGLLGKGAEKGIDWLTEKFAKGTAKTLLTASEPVDKYMANPSKYNVDTNVEKEAMRLKPALEGMERATEDAQSEAVKRAGLAAEARGRATQDLRDTLPSPAAEQALLDALNAQRGKTSSLAQKQRAMLANAPQEFDVDPVRDVLQQRLNTRKVGGVIPTMDPEVQDVNKMLQFVNEVKNRNTPAPGPQLFDHLGNPLPTTPRGPAKIGAEDMLNLRQTLDKIAAPAWTAPGVKHVAPGASAARDARGAINKLLDDVNSGVPGYSSLRQDLAKETRLAESATDALGDPNMGRTLRRMASPDRAPDYKVLQELDANTGGKISPELRDYLEAKVLLRDKPRLQQHLGSLPESQAADAAEAAARGAKDHHSKLNGIGSSNIDAKLREAMFAHKNKPQLQTMAGLDELGGRTGEDLRDLVDTLGVRAAFGKEGAQGSRLVNAMSNLAPSGLKGFAALVGAGLDVGRGRTAKAVLDAQRATAGRAALPLATGASRPVIDDQVDKDEQQQLDALLRMLGEKK